MVLAFPFAGQDTRRAWLSARVAALRVGTVMKALLGARGTRFRAGVLAIALVPATPKPRADILALLVTALFCASGARTDTTMTARQNLAARLLTLGRLIVNTEGRLATRHAEDVALGAAELHLDGLEAEAGGAALMTLVVVGVMTASELAVDGRGALELGGRDRARNLVRVSAGQKFLHFLQASAAILMAFLETSMTAFVLSRTRLRTNGFFVLLIIVVT